MWNDESLKLNSICFFSDDVPNLPPKLPKSLVETFKDARNFSPIGRKKSDYKQRPEYKRRKPRNRTSEPEVPRRTEDISRFEDSSPDKRDETLPAYPMNLINQYIANLEDAFSTYKNLKLEYAAAHDYKAKDKIDEAEDELETCLRGELEIYKYIQMNPTKFDDEYVNLIRDVKKALYN